LSLLCRSVLLFTATAIVSFATSLTFLGPFGPGLDDNVIGPQNIFDIKDAILTSPSSPGGLWTLQIDTNYGAVLPGPNPNDVIPDFQLPGVPQITYAMSDFLIQQGSNFYGVVLHTHDNPNDVDTMNNIYTQGNLYQSNGFQDAIHFTKNPVYLNAGGTLLGTGTVTAVQSDPTNPFYGKTIPEFTITVTFSAPADFLNGPFTIFDSSADCGNAFFTGDGSFVPEPGTWALVTPALLLLGFFMRRRSVRN
jgi:hypothetical protein